VGHPARPAGAMIRRAGDEPAGDETMHAGAGEAGGGEAGGGEAGPDGEAAEAPAPDSERAGEQPPESARERLRRARQERRQRGASGPRPEGMGTRARDREQGTDEGDGAVPAHTGPSTGARPNVELLLQKQDLDEILEVKVPTDVHALSGLEPSDEYDGAYWGSADGSSYVAGLQIWRPHSPVKANSRYSRMVRSYPNAEETTAITNKTFLAYWNDIIYLVFFEPGKQTVVSLTCHKKVCNSPAKLVKLGLKVKERL